MNMYRKYYDIIEVFKGRQKRTADLILNEKQSLFCRPRDNTSMKTSVVLGYDGVLLGEEGYIDFYVQERW